MSREKWHEGWKRNGDVIMYGHPHCAGCGKFLGCCALGIEEGWVPPPDPQWPFDEAGCPLCALRDREPPIDILPSGLLPTAANLYRELKACREQLRLVLKSH